MDDRQALVQLNLLPLLGPVSIRKLLDALGSPQAVFEVGPPVLEEILGWRASPKLLQGLRGASDGSPARQELDEAARQEVQLLTWLDPGYPKLLSAIHDPPVVLYVKGELLPEDAMSVAMVGTRRATPYGLQTARELARELAKAGLTVISGLAEGIDGAAHEGALEEGRTIAVLGHGLNTLYPAHHAKLAARIAASGALVSEFPLKTGPEPGYFPRRNRVISGFSLGVVVVEAPESSGALITASAALEQGREVFAVPGPVTSWQSEGSHRLIQEGAKLTRKVEDILEELAPQLKARLGEISHRAVAAAPRLSLQEETIYQAVPVGGDIAVEELAKTTATPPANLLPVLTGLELKGLIRQLPGRGFSRPK